MRLTIQLLILSFFSSFMSCRSVEDVAYFQKTDNAEAHSGKSNPPKKQQGNQTVSDYLIRPNDILSVYVSSLSPEASSFFNSIAPVERNEQSNINSFSTRTDIGYTVDPKGMIDLPLIGKIKVAGMSTSAAKDTLKRQLERFLQFPSVRIYIQNFRITILGEVNKPGMYNVTNEKISIAEAIGLAGDMSIFANRKNLTLIRETENGKQYFNIDFTQRDLFNSPHYYLQSGDILYVSPVKGRVAQSDNFYRVTPLILSSLTLIAVLVTRFVNGF